MTLVSLLEERADRAPDRIGFTVLDRSGAEADRATYAALAIRARSIGARIQELVRAGDRVLVMTPPSLDFVAGFFGAMYAGAIAVPAYPVLRPAEVPRLDSIVRDARITVAVTTAPLLALTRALVADRPALASLRWVCADADESTPDAVAWRQPDLGRDALAFLQYTSGSTGTPKGVMISHANALANQHAIRAAFGHDSERTVMANWLPLYHDMGLGSVLQSLFLGRPLVMMSPLDFLQRPALWLRAISRYRVTTSGGPCFAYDLCARRISEADRAELDLGSWDLAFNGAEPIRAEALDRFVGAFAPHGFRRTAFYPCYGLAESVLFVSGGEKHAEPLLASFDRAALEHHRVEPVAAGRTLVGCGHAWPGHRTMIVDPDRRVEMPEGQVGEIWVAGPSVARGYWNDELATRDTFEARLLAGDGPFLRTGDLGFVRGGELFITGRIKDVIIIRGRNHYAEDIERTAEQAHAALRPGCGAAFAIDDAGEERLVVVHEVRDVQATDRRQVEAGVRELVAQHHGLQVHAVVLAAPGAVPKTSSGKVQRRACRTRFLGGELRGIGES